MKNPVNEIITTGKPFVYFHTQLFNEGVVEAARQADKSLEVDVSVDENGELFAGHPYEFYKFKQMDPPADNLPLDTIAEQVKEAGLYLVLDCKDVRALPWVTQTVQSLGANNTLFHSWITAFQFKPYAPEIVIEPHWIYEDLPLDNVLEMKRATGVPVISAVRGLTQERLQREPEIVDKIIETAAGNVDAVSFNLPNGEAPPAEIMQKLLDHGLLTWLNVDRVPPQELPKVYIGISDHLESVTDPKEFN